MYFLSNWYILGLLCLSVGYLLKSFIVHLAGASRATFWIVYTAVMSKFFINFREERRITDQFIKAFRTKVTGRDQIIGSLSGGNQQKVVIARSLSTNPKVLILDEPTRGIDAAARGDVYTIIEQLKAQGLAILLISSDMEEIVELSDRAVTMFCGHINQEFAKCDISQDNLMAAAFGVTEGSAKNA